MNNNILKYAIGHALAAAGYIALVVTFITYIADGLESSSPKFLVPMMMLLLFVTSAAVMAMLIFARPAMWYLEGRKKEAVHLVVSTIACLVLIAALLFLFASSSLNPNTTFSHS